MNIDYLGDALDHWKGSVIEQLRPVLHNLRVVPMCMEEEWTPKHRCLYARLLGVRSEDDVFWDAFNRNRRRYFENCQRFAGDSDLFLDPDTGIEPISGCKKCHVGLDNLRCLLPDNSRRLVMVYQHRSRIRHGVEDVLDRNSVEDVLERIRQRGWLAGAYWAGAASMLFLSRKQGRVAGVRDRLDKWLGPCSVGKKDGHPPRRLFFIGLAE